jgi:hypothetical protein
MVDGSLLWTVDIRDPGQPERRSLKRLPGHPLQVAMSRDGHLLVAAGEAGLLVFDVDDATAPRQVGALDLPGMALDVAVAGSGDLALVTAGRDGLFVVDIGVPERPEALSKIMLPGFAYAVDAEQEMVYVASCTTLNIVKLTDPRNPEHVGAFWVPRGHAKDVDAVGTEVYVAGGEALFGYDASDPEWVIWKGYYAEPDVPGFYVNAVTVRDGIAYIAAGDESVRSVDISQMPAANGFPAKPVTTEDPPDLDGPEVLDDNNLRTVETIGGDPIGIGLVDDLLLVLGNFRYLGERTLRIMRVGPPGRMVDVTTYIQPNRWLGISQLEDNLILHGATGHETVTAPGGDYNFTFVLPGRVRRAVEHETGIYLLVDGGELYRWRTVGEPADRLLSSASMAAYDIAIGGQGIGYFSDYQLNQIRLFTLDPVQIRGFAINVPQSFLGYAHLFAHGDYLYAYDWVLGLLHTFHVPGPYELVHRSELRIGLCEMYDIADFYAGRKEIRSKMFAADDRLFVLCPHNEDGVSSLLELNLANPAIPQLADITNLPAGRYTDIRVQGDVLYTVAFDNNVYRSEIRRSRLGNSWSLEFDGHANGLAFVGPMAYLIDGDWGLGEFNPDDMRPEPAGYELDRP